MDHDPTKEDIERILLDQADDLSAIFLKEGYQIKKPRAEWSVAGGCLRITKEDETYNIQDIELQLILKGLAKVPEEDMKLIKEWYEISAYKYGFEIEQQELLLKKAKEEYNQELAEECIKKIEALVRERKTYSRRDLIKKQLAYCYNEEGERLDRLYDLLWGSNETRLARFGKITLHISMNAYKDSIKEKEYARTKGFFEDLKNAYDLVKETRSDIEYSPTAGVAYSSEWIGGEGQGKLVLDDRVVELSVEIKRDGMKNILSCVLKTETDLEEYILQQKEPYLSMQGFDMSHEPVWVARNSNVLIGYLSKVGEKGAEIFFNGDPETLEQEISEFFRIIYSQ